MPESNPVKYYTPEEEIDLRESVRNMIVYVRNHFSILFVFALAGLATGYGAFLLIPRSYEVSMIADSRILSSQVVISIVNSWQELLEKKERGLLARKMNVSPEVVNALQKVEAEPNETTRITEQSRSAFIINATVSNTRIVDSLQAGMVYYLENSQYMQERTKSEKRKLQAFKARIEQELAQMDMVKSSLQGMLRKGSNSAGGFITEPGNVNSEIVTIYEQLLETDQALEFVDNIQVISSFDQVENPSSPKLSVCLAAGMALGIFTAMLIVFLRHL
jgi:uncharacterized protein involved in exopolysaccharide biosynthesis